MVRATRYWLILFVLAGVTLRCRSDDHDDRAAPDDGDDRASAGGASGKGGSAGRAGNGGRPASNGGSDAAAGMDGGHSGSGLVAGGAKNDDGASGASGGTDRGEELGGAGGAGASGAVGADGGGGSTGSAGTIGTGGTSGSIGMGGDGGASDNAGAGGDGGMGGNDCIPPSDEGALSAASAGLPSAGLVLWLRGDRGVSKTADARVCSWSDQSGNARVLSSPIARPLWVADGVGTRPAIYFDAVNTYLSTPDVLGLSATSARTFVAIVQLVGTAGRFHSLIQGTSGTPGNYLAFDANTWQTAGSREGIYVMEANSYDASTATSAGPRVHVFTLGTLTSGAAVSANVDYRINGSTQSLTRKQGGGNFGSFATANFTTVGDVDDVSTVHPAVGDAFVAEVLVYDRALTVDERSATETALMVRYGIP